MLELLRKQIQGSDGTVLTHRAWGFSFDPVSSPPLVVYAVCGVLSATGAFVPWEETTVTVQIAGKHFVTLAGTLDQPRDFTLKDIIALHRALSEPPTKDTSRV